MIFGECHWSTRWSALPASEDYYDYLNSGIRLLNFPLYNEFNNILE